MRIIKVGRQVSRAQAYHSVYGCKALGKALLRSRFRRGRRVGFRELTLAQVKARGLHACPWCHGVRPGPRASSGVLPGLLEIRQLEWPVGVRAALADAMREVRA